MDPAHKSPPGFMEVFFLRMLSHNTGLIEVKMIIFS